MELKLNIVRKSVLFILIYRFNRKPIESLVDLFENRQVDFKMYMETQRT